MSLALLPILFAVAVAEQNLPPSATQLPDFSKTTNGSIGVLTTSSGAPVEIRETNVQNKNLLDSEYFMDHVQSFVRERIPERVVHAPGTGAFGYFETTHDITNICKAKLFSKVGKKTPIAVRFSLSAPRSGSPDSGRLSRGFAIKFYTEEGNLDLTGFNLPLFSFKNPALIIALSHILKTNPATLLPDSNMMWDHLTLNPESIFVNMYLLSDYGTPPSYSDMTGHPVHTYQVYNKDGVSSYMKFHIVPTQGAKYVNASEAAKIAASDPNYYAKDLYNKIGKGKFPSYDLKAQILSEKDRLEMEGDMFDVTKLIDEKRFPLQTIGRFILNKNPLNQFAEIESLTFSPGNVVPGIIGSPDTTFQARRFAYRDAQIYRLGSNFKKIPVNCPIQSPVLNYVRDGIPPLNDNGRNTPNYYPNSFNGAAPYKDNKRPELIKIVEPAPNNFKQAGNFYANVLTSAQKTSLVENFINALCTCVQIVKDRAIKYFKIINSDFGTRVAEGLAARCA